MIRATLKAHAAWMALIPLLWSAAAHSADGKQILQSQCVQCHTLDGNQAGTDIRDRKGPDLSYAGNKYKRDWLVSWLQKPVRIRPAGMYYGRHVMSTKDGDAIDESTLQPHMALPEPDATAAAEALMNQKAKSNLISEGEYKSGSIPLSLGEMMFDKFRGCFACHQIEPGYGGLSGPEVYTAADRLQEDFLISYMRDPQAWNPGIFMPSKNLSDTDLQKFVHYFRALSKEDWQ